MSVDVHIEADSQAEFEAKRRDLVKALAGRSPVSPRRGVFAYQNALLARLNASYRRHMEQAKREIEQVLQRGLSHERERERGPDGRA